MSEQRSVDKGRSDLERFMDWADPKGFCLDQIFMSTEGVPENPFEDRDTKIAFDIWLAATKAARSLSADAGGLLAELRAINALMSQAWEKEQGGAFTPLAGALNRIGKLIAAVDTGASSASTASKPIDKDYLKFQIGLFLEDVAEKPDRLKRAQELANNAIDAAIGVNATDKRK